MKFQAAKFLSSSGSLAEHRCRSFRAVALGAAAIAGGSLAVTTIIGTAAIAGMLWAGSSPENTISELTGSFELTFFCALGGLVMSIMGGYSAATIAGRSPVTHAVFVGVLAMPFNLIALSILGDSGPAWLTMLANLLVIPSAALGGWLASPIPATVPATAQKL
jgi:hypothetical protein